MSRAVFFSSVALVCSGCASPQAGGDLEAATAELSAAGWPLDTTLFELSAADEEHVRRFARASLEASAPVERASAMTKLYGVVSTKPVLDGARALEVELENLAASLRAFFDPTDGRVYVAQRPAEATDLSMRHVLVHELVHAHQHQQRRFRELLATATSNDELQVALCLLEGEAEFVGFRVERGAAAVKSSRDRAVLLPDVAFDRGVLTLPYAVGLYFFARAASDGTRAAVLEALDPRPRSTEQVLHPRKLGLDAPRAVELPELAAGAQVVHVDTLGELQIQHLLHELGLGQLEAALAACGWDGDRLRVTRDSSGGETLVWRTVWDREEDARAFAAALRTRGCPFVRCTGASVDVDASSAPTDPFTDAPVSADAFTTYDANSTQDEERALVDAYRRGLSRGGQRWKPAASGLAFVMPGGWTIVSTNDKEGLAKPQSGESFTPIVTVICAAADGQVIDATAFEARRAELGEQSVVRLTTVAGMPALTSEWIEQRDGQRGHLLAIEFVHGARRVQVTAVCLESQWPRIEQQVRAILESAEPVN